MISRLSRTACPRFETEDDKSLSKMGRLPEVEGSGIVRLMSNFRFFQKTLIFELTVIAAVATIFRLITERLIAGALAGTLFVALGLWIVISGVRSKTLRRSATFIMGCVHLFAIALPMVITRFMNAALAFADVRILGLPGPVFHQLSTGVYALMIVATVGDAIFWRRREITRGR